MGHNDLILHSTDGKAGGLLQCGEVGRVGEYYVEK